MYLHSKYLFSGNTGHAVWIYCYFYPPEKIPWTRQYQVWVSISRVWQLSALSSTAVATAYTCRTPAPAPAPAPAVAHRWSGEQHQPQQHSAQ